MKLQAVLDFVDKIKPGNPYDAATKIQWLNELEGDIQSKVLNTAPQEIIQYTVEDAETELLIPVPYDKVYWMWVSAMIDFANGEYDKYQNTLQMVNDAYDDYAKWFHRKFHQDTGGFLFIGGTTKYGLSAYEIAANHGFEGTEEEWLASLHGTDGKDGYTPVKGVDYFDGISVTHEWNGTVLSVTSANGTSSAELKGDPGYTPVKGADYWTEEDLDSMVQSVKDNLPVYDGEVDGETGESEVVNSAVLYTEQTPTEEQKAQARENISATSEEYATKEFGEIRDDLNGIKEDIYTNSKELDTSTLVQYTDYVVKNGYITWRGEIVTQYNGKYTELIPVEMLGSITLHLPEGIGNISLCRYGEDQEFLNSVVMADGQVITNTIGCSYVAITTSLSNISEADFRNLFEIIAHPYVPAVSFVARPMVGSQINDGESGQVLTSNGDGTTKWVDFADGENPFKGKTAVTFGDSITWYDGHNFGQYHAQAGTIAVGYQSYMRSKLGLTVNNQGISGAAMPEILAAVKAFDYTNVDYVTITTGANDYADVLRGTETIGELSAVGSAFDETSLYGSLQSAVEYILSQKNTIKIYLMTPIKGWWSTGVLPQTYAQAIIDVGALYSIPVHDWYSTSGINEINKSIYIGDITTSGTYLHPTNEGYARMSERFISFLKQG